MRPEDADPDHALAPTGVVGLDAILGGGLPRHHTYLVQGDHGTGKTTLGLQFCMKGAALGERALYLTTCETEDELREIACSHGWSLSGIEIHHLRPEDPLGTEPEQSVFHPAEVELPRTIETLRTVIDRVDPQRLVLDSLSEIRLLAANQRSFHRQVFALRDDLARRRCTTLICDRVVEPSRSAKSIVHGVIDLEQRAIDYGPDRRRLRIAKIRGHRYGTGYHDMRIRTGGIDIHPRLVAAEHRTPAAVLAMPTGLSELDQLFGGAGIGRGTSLLLLGPAGTGKSSVASQVVAAAADRGERSALYVFDERVQTLLQRASGLGIDLREHIERGLTEVRQVDPAELTPGEFSAMVREAAERGARLVVIDSLTGYFHAMPDERQLTLHLHELLVYLNEQGITVLMTMPQHGVPGGVKQAPVDLSYIADSVVLFHAFEHAGELRKAISVYKHRAGAHEATLRELQLVPGAIRVGAPLRSFQRLLSGMPRFVGDRLPDVTGEDQRATAGDALESGPGS